jgi:hypothetical protein
MGSGLQLLLFFVGFEKQLSIFKLLCVIKGASDFYYETPQKTKP